MKSRLLLLFVALPIFAQVSTQVKVLKATPQTVQWGYYAAEAKPAIVVKSGETLRVECVSTGSPAMFARIGAVEDDALRDLKLINAEVKDKGPGGHVLTGPIGVEGAEPGNVLQVDILEIEPRSTYGYNSFGATSGILPDDFPYSRSRNWCRSISKANVAEFAPGIRIPLRPFFGSMGVGPAAGRVASGPPGYFAGNMDNKEFVAGTTLFLPVQQAGALLSIGDGHVAMGDGEVDITAIESALTGTFRLTVRKDMHLLWPRAETPTHYITMGFHESLDEAIRRAAREMIDYLVTAKGMTKDDAYMLTSVAVDMHVTQAVDGVRGVHALLPKSIFVKCLGSRVNRDRFAGDRRRRRGHERRRAARGVSIPDLQITVLEKGPDVSYGACGLPWFIAGKIRGEQLRVYSADFFRDERKIEVFTGVEALEIEMGRRRVRTRDQIFSFDRLGDCDGRARGMAIDTRTRFASRVCREHAARRPRH